MPNSSSYLRQKLLNHVLVNSVYTSPTTVYLSLATSVTSYGDTFVEVPTAWGYGRQVIQFGSYTNVAGQGQLKNTGLINFTAGNTHWLPVPYFGIHDAVSGGNLLFWGVLANTMQIENTFFPQLSANQLSVLLD